MRQRDLHSFPTRTLFRSRFRFVAAAVLEFQPHPAIARAVLVTLVGQTHATLGEQGVDRKSTRLNSSHMSISYAVFCLKKKNRHRELGPAVHVRGCVERAC